MAASAQLFVRALAEILFKAQDALNDFLLQQARPVLFREATQLKSVRPIVGTFRISVCRFEIQTSAICFAGRRRPAIAQQPHVQQSPEPVETAPVAVARGGYLKGAFTFNSDIRRIDTKNSGSAPKEQNRCHIPS